MEGKKRKSVLEYDNYRDFLRDFYQISKSEDPKFSLGYFSKRAGFKSRSVLLQVISGNRNIAVASIPKFAKALKLNRAEADFFSHLVLFNQAKTIEQKNHYAQEILNFKEFRKLSPLKESQYNYFNHWYFVVIREMAFLKGFSLDVEWILQNIQPKISRSECRRAVDELIKLNLFKQNSSGKLVPNKDWLFTPDEVISSAIANFHQQMLRLASESMERFAREQRDISALTFAVSQNTAKTIKEKIQMFRKEIEGLVSQDETVDSVYQFNLQLFPVALSGTKSKP